MTSSARVGTVAGTLAASVAQAARHRARQLNSSAARVLDTDRVVSRWTVLTAALAPLLVLVAWLLADALQPRTYSPVRQSVSVLAGRAAQHAWVMTGGLYLAAACYFATAAGLHGIQRSARVLLVIAGIAGIGIAACPEPSHGSTDQHLAWAALGAAAIALWPTFASAAAPRRESRGPLAQHSTASIVVSVVFLVLLAWLTYEARYGHALGLAERVYMAIQTSWPLVITLLLRHRGDPDPARR